MADSIMYSIHNKRAFIKQDHDEIWIGDVFASGYVKSGMELISPEKKSHEAKSASKKKTLSRSFMSMEF